MDTNKTPVTSTQTEPTIPLLDLPAENADRSSSIALKDPRRKVTRADMERLMDQGLREQAAREAALESREAIAITMRESAAPRVRLATGEATLPSAAQLLRQAARVGEIGSGETFARVASKCIASLKGQLGERYSPQLAALERFQIYDHARQAAGLEVMRTFIADMENVLRETRGLVLYGSSGTGKDHLLAAALYHVAAAGIPTAWVSGEAIYASIRDSMDTHKEEATVIAPFLRPIVLGMSYPFPSRGDLSEWDARILARLLDQRYQALRQRG